MQGVCCRRRLSHLVAVLPSLSVEFPLVSRCSSCHVLSRSLYLLMMRACMRITDTHARSYSLAHTQARMLYSERLSLAVSLSPSALAMDPLPSSPELILRPPSH